MTGPQLSHINGWLVGSVGFHQEVHMYRRLFSERADNVEC